MPVSGAVGGRFDGRLFDDLINTVCKIGFAAGALEQGLDPAILKVENVPRHTNDLVGFGNVAKEVRLLREERDVLKKRPPFIDRLGMFTCLRSFVANQNR